MSEQEHEQRLKDAAYRAEVAKETGLDLMPGEKLYTGTEYNDRPRSWRDGVKIRAMVEDPSEIVEVGGRWLNDVKVTLGPEQVERIRQGYVCIECLEPQETPFPERCSAFWCKYEMKNRQAEEFARRFQGYTRTGPTGTYEEELAQLEEDSARRKSERQKERGEKPSIFIAKPGLWLPDTT